MADSEFHLDPNCLSRCSTELFCEASWEQVDKQDTEVSHETVAGLRQCGTTKLRLLTNQHIDYPIDFIQNSSCCPPL